MSLEKRVLDGNIPAHIAIILDGNGRWAKKRGLPRTLGHKKGADNLKNIAIESSLAKGEKLGFKTPFFVFHPFIKDKKIPVYVSNFILMDYGTGAIFGCPAHDVRDFEFATKYELPIISTFLPMEDADPKVTEAYVPMKTEKVFYNGGFAGEQWQTGEQAIAAAIDFCETKGIGQGVTKYRLRDWGISRQRYWGCPIPMIHCDDCGIVPVPEADLPVTLPDDVSFEKTGNPLDHHPTWKHVDCPECGNKAQRETDTFDTFFESSWYFAQFTAQPSADKKEVSQQASPAVVQSTLGASRSPAGRSGSKKESYDRATSLVKKLPS